MPIGEGQCDHPGRNNYPTLRDRLSDSDSDQSIVIRELTRRLRIRGKQSGFHPNATQFTLRLDDRLFGIWRQSIDRNQSIFAIHNVSDETVTVSPSAINLIEGDRWTDLLSGDEIIAAGPEIPFQPYQCRWISNRR